MFPCQSRTLVPAEPTARPAATPCEAATRPSAGRTSAHRGYDRARDLPRLLPLWPAEIRDATPEGHHRLLQRLRRALREERRRGLAGDWAYDLARHAALYRAYKAEIALSPLPLTSWAAPPFTRTGPTLDELAGSPPPR